MERAVNFAPVVLLIEAVASLSPKHVNKDSMLSKSRDVNSPARLRTQPDVA